MPKIRQRVGKKKIHIMKRSSLFCIFLIGTICCATAQISTIAPVEQAKTEKPVPTEYVASEPNMTQHVHLFKGQELVVKPLSKETNSGYSDWDYGYKGFHTMKFDVKKHKKEKHIYGQVDKVIGTNTLASELENKVFVVENVESIRGTFRVVGSILDNIEADTCVLILSEKNNPENKCKFVYGYGFGGLGRYEVFPFVVMSHYNYLKDKLVGNEYRFDRGGVYSKDVKTGEKIYNPHELTWKCVDIIMSPECGELTMLLESNGKQTYAEVSKYVGKDIPVDLAKYGCAHNMDKYPRIYAMSKTRWNQNVEKYGLDFMNAVLTHSVLEGMPVEVLKMSLGNPNKINTSSSTTQYVYELYGGKRRYVYLDKGIVIGWN